ncbi:hypothetical protein L6R29_04615 [Myxococcota bacterium]|nr:hypothetical protein [Myxococcota bacterium]
MDRRMQKNCWILSCLFLCLISSLSPMHAQAGDFMDTRITFALSDDNLLLGPGLSNPSSPSTSFVPGARSVLFFDNYNKRDSGFESLSHVALYKEMPSFFKGLTTAAALVVRMDYFLERREFRLTDAGSYIRTTYFFNPEDATAKEKPKLRRNLDIVAFPLSSDRFRMGYSFRISWGGDFTFPRRSIKSPVPGVKAQLNYDFSESAGLSIFLGGKTVLLQQLITREQIEEEVGYGILGGFALRLGQFSWEGGGAFFNKGTFFNPTVKAEPIYFYGGSTQISYAMGIPVGVSMDFALYRNDPLKPQKFFKPEQYVPGKFSFMVAAEASVVANLLENPDPAQVGGIVPQVGIAADLNFRMKYGYWRMHLDVMYRDLSFILQNVPGFVPFQAFANDQVQTPEFFAALGVDYHIAPAHLTLGLIVGLQIPSTFRGVIPKELTGQVPVGSTTGQQIVVVRGEGDFVLLPTVDAAGNKVEIIPIVSAKLTFKWQLSEFMAIIGDVLFSFDSNETRLERAQYTGDGTVVSRVFVDPIRLGFNLMGQARF